MDWKEQLSALAVANSDWRVETAVTEPVVPEQKKMPKQLLRVELDKRKGKLATLITEFEGSEEALKELAKMLKTKLAVGGSARDGEILLQGDVRQKVAALLEAQNCKVRRIGF